MLREVVDSPSIFSVYQVVLDCLAFAVDGEFKGTELCTFLRHERYHILRNIQRDINDWVFFQTFSYIGRTG